MDTISRSKSQVGYFGPNSVTRRQLQQALPNDRALEKVLQQTPADTVEDMVVDLKTHLDKAERRSGNGSLLAALGLGAAAVAAFTVALPITVGAACLGAVGVALRQAGRHAAKQVTQTLQELDGKAKTTLQELVTPSPDGKTFEDHRFRDCGALLAPTEIRESGSGKVLSRRIQVGTENLLVISEDVSQGQIRIEGQGRVEQFQGRLSLPDRWGNLRITHEVPGLGQGEHALNASELLFRPNGKPEFRLVGDLYYDEEFSCRSEVKVGTSGPNLSVHQDGIVYTREAKDDPWYAAKLPVSGTLLGIEDSTVEKAGTVSQAGDLPGLSFNYATEHPSTLASMEAVPLKAGPLESVTYGSLRFEPQAHGWRVRNGSGQEIAFGGELNSQGQLTLKTEQGLLQQDLSGRDVKATLTRGQGKVLVMHPAGGQPTATYCLSPDHTAPAHVEAGPDGSYKVRFQDRLVEFRPILSTQMLGGG